MGAGRIFTWLPNLLPYDQELHTTFQNEWGTLHRMRSPSELPDPLTSEFLLHLVTKPFFNNSSHGSLFTPETGSDSEGSGYAYSHRNRIISEMIPCTTFSAGRNAFNNILKDDPNTPEDENRNIDMDMAMKTDPARWPLSDAHDPEENRPRPWLHSDIREKAFTHNWKSYLKFVEIGNLNTQN
jgi:hypothetical protein